MKYVYTAIFALLLCFPAAAGAQGDVSISVSDHEWHEDELQSANGWTQLWNTGDTPVDLGGWVFASSTTGGKSLTLPGGVVIGAGQTLTLVNYNLSDDESALVISQDTVDESPADESPASFAPGTLIVNEFVSDPAEGKEWIELYNPGNAAIDLDLWSVKDDSGKVTWLKGTIAPKGYHVIEAPSGQLNNSGDSVLLFDPAGSLISKVTYGKDLPAPKKGESLAWFGDAWKLAVPTKGTANVAKFTTQAPAAEEEDEGEQQKNEQETSTNNNQTTQSDQDESKKPVAEKPDTRTTLTGVLTALPGLFGKQIAFMEGVQIYFNRADWPELTLGSRIQIKGEPSSANGESRLKIAAKEDITVLAQADESPKDITASNLSSTPIGTLVRIKGHVAQKNSDELILEDETGAVTVIAHSNTNVNFKAIEGTELTIIGIVRTLSGETRIYPRSLEDITPTVTEEVAQEEQGMHEDEGGGAATTISKGGGGKKVLGGALVGGVLCALAGTYAVHKSKHSFMTT